MTKPNIFKDIILFKELVTIEEEVEPLSQFFENYKIDKLKPQYLNSCISNKRNQLNQNLFIKIGEKQNEKDYQ